MSIAVRNDTVMSPLGQVLSGAMIYVLTQPANPEALTPLATVYSDLTGTPAANPIITNGQGQAQYYLSNANLYTIVYVHPLLFNSAETPNYPTYTDQNVGVTGTVITPFGVVPTGTIDGTRTTFTLPFTPLQVTVWNNFPLIPGLGYTTAVVMGTFTITYANAPQIGDSLFAQGYF